MKHVVLRNSELKGLEYGMLRDFEDEIIRLTNAELLEAPRRMFPKFIAGRLEHGTRYSGLRRFVPKEEHLIEADVLWVILMGPENLTLDLYRDWDKHVGVKILYLFDTFDAHLTSIRRVLRCTSWDLICTAFGGAQRWLEEQTGRKWNTVSHGVNLDRFRIVPTDERVIDFCAYGRRLERVHAVVKKYCSDTGKYYDYTTAAGVQRGLGPNEHYQQYAWHLAHSSFNFCWPMEVTHPQRATRFSPITCRWFEAAASGNILIGQAPNDPHFEELFGKNAVIPFDPDADEVDIRNLLDTIWASRESFLNTAMERRSSLSSRWSWESRVEQILDLIGIPLETPHAASAH